MQEAELLKIYVFYYLAQTELKSCNIDRKNFESCYIVLVQTLHFRIKTRNTSIRNMLLFAMCSKLSSRFLMKFSNLSLVWLVDL